MDAPTLTPLELEIIRLLPGRSNHEIAAALHYSHGHIKNHITDLLAKTHSKSRTELAVRYATGHLNIPRRPPFVPCGQAIPGTSPTPERPLTWTRPTPPSSPSSSSP